ncbi:MAG: OmpA family protein [Bacteroidia bacterium]
MKNLNSIILLLAITVLASCVPSRQFEEMKIRVKDCEDQNLVFKTENQELMTRNTELLTRVNELEKLVRILENDTATLGNSLRRLNNLYNDLTASYDKLLANNEKLLSGSESETRKVISELQMTQTDLQKKEDALRKLEDELNKKNATLIEREAKVAELQGILERQDSMVTALKNTVTEALLGFRGQGLTVEQKNGKVYVSLEERLLFASGSTVVDPKGVNALKELAKVLENNKDINVTVEGHTDDVPISGQCIKDNWDLSVMRATSVVRILLGNSSITPSRLTASGKGEYFPLDSAKSTDARRKNRRTEIILTPKLDELLRILGSN